MKATIFRTMGPLVVVGMLILPNLALAQTLMNPGFDANLQPWVDPGYPDRALSWSALDAGGSGTSGSLLHVSDDTSGGTGLGLEQCVDVDPGGSYLAGGKAMIPSGQAGSGAAWIIISEHDADNCQSYTGRDWNIGPVFVEGSWESFVETQVVVLGITESVMVHLGTWVGSGSVDQEVHFDDIVFVPESNPVFDDGFESGNTSAWTSTTP